MSYQPPNPLNPPDCDYHDPYNDNRDLAVYSVQLPDGRYYYYCDRCYLYYANDTDKSFAVRIEDMMDLSFGRRKNKSRLRKSRKARKSKTKKSRKTVRKSRRSRLTL